MSSDHGAAWRDLDRRDTAAVEHDEPIAVFRAQRAGTLSQCRHHVFQQLVLAGYARFVDGDVHAVAAYEPYTQHCGRHVMKLLEPVLGRGSVNVPS